MSISRTILSGLGALAVLAILLAGVTAIASIRQVAGALDAGRGLSAYADTLKLGALLASERSAWNGAFSSEEPADPSASSPVGKAQSATDAALATARESLAAGGIDTVPLSRAASILTEMRANARAATAQAKSLRPAEGNARMQDAIAAASGMVNSAADLAFRHTATADSALTVPLQIAAMAQDLRSTAGMRSAILSLYESGQPLDAKRLVSAIEDTGQIATLWRLQIQAVANMGSPPGLAEALSTVERTLMQEGEPRYQAVLDAARSGAPSPIDNATWRDWTTPMLNNALIMRDKAIDTAAEMNRQTLDHAWWQLELSLGALAVVAGITALVALVLSRRITRPVECLTDAITRLADGDLDVPIVVPRVKDEIGAIASALIVLRDHARQARAAGHGKPTTLSPG